MQYISIIIPVYNDPDGIADTLSSLISIEYPRDSYEIIVVDNGSTDETKLTIKQHIDSIPNAQLLVEDEIQGSYAARNRGIRHATGDIFVFIDADMSVNSTFLKNINRTFNEDCCDYVGFTVQVYFPSEQTSFAGLHSVATSFPIHFYISEQNYAPTCSLAVRKEVIQDVGLFKSRLISGGDREFGQRVARHGYKQCFIEQIEVYHPARIKLNEKVTKSLRLGRGREQHYQQNFNTLEGRSWYDLRNFLPPHPLRFRRQLQGKYSISLIICFYFMSYLLKLIMVLGQVKERYIS